MTSPSTRRRSWEDTRSLIQGALEGQDRVPEEDQIDGLADRLAGSSIGNSGTHSADARGFSNGFSR